MVRNALLSVFLISASMSYAQLSVEVNYGMQGNFFVTGYDEDAVPTGYTAIYKKNFLGTISGVEVRFQFSKYSGLGVAYARSYNGREITFGRDFNGITLTIMDFTVRHINNYYQAYFEQNVIKSSPNLKGNLGLFYLRMSQQEIDITPFGIAFEERNFKNSKLEEGGVFLGLQYETKIDTRFKAGIRTRGYYLVSTQSFEAITLTPTLSYVFR